LRDGVDDSVRPASWASAFDTVEVDRECAASSRRQLLQVQRSRPSRRVTSPVDLGPFPFHPAPAAVTNLVRPEFGHWTDRDSRYLRGLFINSPAPALQVFVGIPISKRMRAAGKARLALVMLVLAGAPACNSKPHRRPRRMLQPRNL
jgi:hypothetical protein